MKKFLFMALSLIAATMMFNSCIEVREAQPIVRWGFENTEEPGNIDGSMFMGSPYKFVLEAVAEELVANPNWNPSYELILSGSEFIRVAPASESTIRKELTDMFNTALTKAEDAMKANDMELSDTKVNVLVQYTFMDDAQTTLKFTIAKYLYKE